MASSNEDGWVNVNIDGEITVGDGRDESPDPLSESREPQMKYGNIHVRSGCFYVDVETESCHIKSSGPMSEFPAAMAQEIKTGLPEIPNSLLEAMKDKKEDQVISLLQRGVDANSMDHHGCALTYAIKWQNEKVVTELLQRGADANSKDHHGCVLTYAIKWRNEEVVMELLRRGANANSTDHHGCTPTYAERHWPNPVTPPKQGTLASASTQKSSGSGQTTINGYFAPGTRLEISTPGGSTQIFSSGHAFKARNVSAGHRSFQYIGDESALRKIRR